MTTNNTAAAVPNVNADLVAAMEEHGMGAILGALAACADGLRGQVDQSWRTKPTARLLCKLAHTLRLAQDDAHRVRLLCGRGPDLVMANDVLAESDF